MIVDWVDGRNRVTENFRRQGAAVQSDSGRFDVSFKFGRLFLYRVRGTVGITWAFIVVKVLIGFHICATGNV